LVGYLVEESRLKQFVLSGFFFEVVGLCFMLVFLTNKFCYTKASYL